VARDFKQFIRICGMTHVRTSPYYPQSNGKKERWFGTLKRECLRPGTPISLEDARRLVARFVEHYNTVWLHSAIGYVAPADKLLGLEPVIHAQRDRKLVTLHPNEARCHFADRNQQANCACPASLSRRSGRAGEGSCWLFEPKYSCLPQERYCTWVKCYQCVRDW